MKNLKGWISRVLLVFVSVGITSLAIETGLRHVYLPDPWTNKNFTVDAINQQLSNLAIKYDPTIGYIARPELQWGGHYTHGKLGIRLNAALEEGAAFPPLPRGAILAVGDSFTFGSEVADADAWPAQLEEMLGVPVLNGGAGGYGLDQAVLRAEQLLESVGPVAIIVSFIPNCIGRNEYSVHAGGLVKSYFDVVDGRLDLRNTPVPLYRPPASHIGVLRATLGYSFTAYWILDRLGLRNTWLIFEGETRVEHRKGVDVSCLLWQRLAERVQDKGVRLIALAQYAAVQVTGEDASRKDSYVERVLDCARSAGFLVVDSHAPLRALFEADRATFWPLWVEQAHDKGTERHTGHMSASGNRFTAELLNRAIRAEYPALTQQLAAGFRRPQ